MRPNLLEIAYLITITEAILNEKLFFLCNVLIERTFLTAMFPYLFLASTYVS